MEFHWIPPPSGTLKINMLASFSTTPYPNRNDMGIGAIYRNHSGVLMHVTLGILPNLSKIGNQRWSIYAPMRRAFYFGYKSIIIETDNYEAFNIILNFGPITPSEVYDSVDQIDALRCNSSWVCSISIVYPARNRVARYAAKLRMEVGDMLYTLDRPVGAIEELLDWDLGIGVDHPNFIDVALPMEAPDPINFDVRLILADNVDNLGLGQADDHHDIIIDREVDEPMDGLDGFQEQIIVNVASFNEAFLFSDEPPLDGVD